LSARGFEYRRTHDLAWLLDFLDDSTGLKPPHSEWIDELNPYAVEARYSGLMPSGLDRSRVLRATEEIVHWVGDQLQAGVQPP